ncbi:MAG TPA: sigma-70 family RNA polymerase sigma factor [Solirubrobacteraceae bacterium]|nr:sigma-70 family RNA polymerase sigma factor [Solirubrobacteraceae bacterium]
MTHATTISRARQGNEEAFRELTDPYRRELQIHCYRILGSLQDAEDMLQETLLAAWRGLDQFQGRSSLRSWLYRIATNRCLNALRDSERSPLITRPDLPPPNRMTEPLWLEPYPDSMLEGIPDTAPGPEARYEAKESIALAFVAGLQHLPPRQRAVLVLRDVLGFGAAEVANMLDTSEASANSALQRARATLDARVPAARERAPLPRSDRERRLLGRFAEAFESGDVDAIVKLLTDDAVLTMPPEPGEYAGHQAIAKFLSNRFATHAGRRVRLIPTRANAQPAFGHYIADAQSPICHSFGVLVLTLEGDRIARLTRFGGTGILPQFGLPRTLPE